MLRTNNQEKHDYFNSSAVQQNGMSTNEPFLIAGQGSEPQYIWDDNSHSFNKDKVRGYGLYLCQNSGQYVQNPIFVTFDGLSEAKANSFQFGDVVKVEGLRGFFSKRYKCWRWKADEISKVTGAK